jgi:hypothetical protein
MKRIREFLESIVFVGLKPGSQAAPKSELWWLGPLRGPVERILSGSAPSDPLYLSNRTSSQKLKSWTLIGIPCLILALGIGVTLSDLLDPPDSKPIKEPSASEIAAKLLPHIEREFKATPESDVQVVEVKVEGSRVVGVVRNSSPREIALAELVIDLTDSSGSQVGAVNAIIEKIPASGDKAFQIPIKQPNAAFSLVREIKAR